MKKSVLTVACLSGLVGGVAYAQSSVQVYGVATTGIGYVDKVATPAAGARATGSRVGLDSGQYTQSRLGFRGTEDLGGGLKAAFNIEGGFTMDNGASAQGGLTFGRRTTIALSGSAGTIELGRRKDYIDEVSSDYSTETRMLPFTGKVHANNMDRSTGERVNNMIYYLTPEINGFQGNLSYGFGETAGSTSAGQSIGFGGNYASGPFAIGFGYLQSKLGVVTATSNSSSDQGASGSAGCNTPGLGAPGDTCIKTWMLGSSYKLGDLTLRGTYSQAKQPLIRASAGSAPSFATTFTRTAGSGAFAAGGSNNSKAKIIDVGADYAMGPWLLKGSVIHSRYDFVGAANDGRLTVLAAGVDYILSKRTRLYGMIGHMTASDMYSPGLTSNGAPGADNSQNALALGILHRF